MVLLKLQVLVSYRSYHLLWLSWGLQTLQTAVNTNWQRFNALPTTVTLINVHEMNTTIIAAVIWSHIWSHIQMAYSVISCLVGWWMTYLPATIQIIQERSAQIILKLGDVLFNLISSQQIMASYCNKQEMTKYSVIQNAYSVTSCLVVGKEWHTCQLGQRTAVLRKWEQTKCTDSYVSSWSTTVQLVQTDVLCNNMRISQCILVQKYLTGHMGAQILSWDIMG